MVMSAIQLENKVNYSSGTATKDKVLSVRVEEGLYNLLEQLTEDWNSGSVSKTVRTLLLYYFLPMVYEEQWKKLTEGNFSRFVQEVLNSGNEMELQNYRNLLAKFSDYYSDMKTIAEKMTASEQFFNNQVEQLELVANKLEEVSILWKGELFEGKKGKRTYENEPVS
jgi:hypothetical protein